MFVKGVGVTYIRKRVYERLRECEWVRVPLFTLVVLDKFDKHILR